MNSIKSIIFLCLLSFILSEDLIDDMDEQDEYKCASNIKLDTCFFRIKKEDGKTLAYVDGCGKGKICSYVDRCEKREICREVCQCVKPKTLLEEGDKCELAEECQSGLCSSNKCIVKKEGEACTENSNCGEGLYCRKKDDAGTCQKFLKEGDVCESDDYDYLECQTGFSCSLNRDNTKKVCTKKYSLDDGAKVDDSFVCKSGSKYNKDGQNYCATIKSQSQCKEDSGSYTYDLTLSLGGATDEVIAQPDGCGCDSSNKCKCYYYWYSLSDTSKEFTDYKEAYLKKLDDLIKDDDTDFKTIDDDYLNDKDLLEKYVLYEYKDEIPSGDDKDCVVDFFMTYEKNSSSYLKLSFFTLFALLLFI